MTIPKELDGVIASDPEIMRGAPSFVGTRVPLWVFLDHLESGVSLSDFHESFPRVTSEQTVAVLSWLAKASRQLINLDTAS